MSKEKETEVIELVLGGVRQRIFGWGTRRFSEESRIQFHAAHSSGVAKAVTKALNKSKKLNGLLLKKDFGNESIRLSQDLKNFIKDNKVLSSNETFTECFDWSLELIKHVLEKSFGVRDKEFLVKRFPKFVREIQRNSLIELSKKYNI